MDRKQGGEKIQEFMSGRTQRFYRQKQKVFSKIGRIAHAGEEMFRTAKNRKHHESDSPQPSGRGVAIDHYI